MKLISKPLSEYVEGDNPYDDCNEEGGTEGIPSAYHVQGQVKKRSHVALFHLWKHLLCENRSLNPPMYDFQFEEMGVTSSLSTREKGLVSRTLRKTRGGIYMGS